MSFGKLIKEKRLKKNMTMKDVANRLELSVSYLSDIEKGRRNPLELDKLQELSKILSLTQEEKNQMMDLAGKERNEVSPDLSNYVVKNQVVTDALRTAKNVDISEQEWFDFIEKILNKKEGEN